MSGVNYLQAARCRFWLRPIAAFDPRPIATLPPGYLKPVAYGGTLKEAGLDGPRLPKREAATTERHRAAPILPSNFARCSVNPLGEDGGERRGAVGS